MLITLALLPMKVSLTIAALLTVGLLPWALLSAMTLAMLGMVWRGEAWKAAYHEIEAQVSQLPPQCRQLLPKTASIGQCQSLPYAEDHYVFAQFCTTINPCAYRTLAGEHLHTTPSAGHSGAYNNSLVQEASDHLLYLILSETLSLEMQLRLYACPQKGISADPSSNYHTQSRPTPIDFI
jgi:hypothetical protein